MDTLEPLAAAIGGMVEPDETLAEAMGAKAVDAWRLWVAEGGTTVLCTHGDVVLALLEHVAETGVRVRPKGMPSKGSVWSFTGAGAIESAQYLRPPA
jgi:hypothetical protein